MCGDNDLPRVCNLREKMTGNTPPSNPQPEFSRFVIESLAMQDKKTMRQLQNNESGMNMRETQMHQVQII